MTEQCVAAQEKQKASFPDAVPTVKEVQKITGLGELGVFSAFACGEMFKVLDPYQDKAEKSSKPNL